jgi:hypothetical protein
MIKQESTQKEGFKGSSELPNDDLPGFCPSWTPGTLGPWNPDIPFSRFEGGNLGHERFYE